MNGIERITNRIEADARAEIDRILGAAREEAEQIRVRGRAQAEVEASALRERGEKAAAEREERLVSMARMEARQMSLAVKQEMVEKAYALALEKLCTMPDETYIQVAAELLTQAAPGGRGEVIFNSTDAGRVGATVVALANEKLGGKLTLSGEIRPISGGFLLKNGNVEINGTFETLVRLQRTLMAGTVAKKLFPKE